MGVFIGAPHMVCKYGNKVVGHSAVDFWKTCVLWKIRLAWCFLPAVLGKPSKRNYNPAIAIITQKELVLPSQIRSY